MDRDMGKFAEFATYLHNEAGNLSVADIKQLVMNPNFRQSTAISKKLLQMGAIIRSSGGLVGILKKFGPVLETMKTNNLISKDFDKNLRYLSSTISSNQVINPSSSGFQRLFKTIAATETDLQALEMGESLTELYKDYKKKDTRLFNLNHSISPTLRFRVLQDADPRTLRIGIETNCCQRIGGVGEAAAKDSFVNPLAGVVILENNVKGNWELLTQSYFHYIPASNGFILDNVEHNANNVKYSGINVEAAYATLGQELKSKFNISYFLAGKGYSKINEDFFGTQRLKGGDPRFFSEKEKYTDFQASDTINLLNPKFDVASASLRTS